MSVASFSANAALEDSWTFGVKGGWAHSYIDSKDDVKVSDKNAFGYGAYVGYNFTDWFGIEVAYNGFSNFKINDGNGSHKLKIYGPEVATRFAYPLDENGSDIFARIGIAYHTDHLSNSNHGADAWDPLLGIGIQYAFTRNFAARAGYDAVLKRELALPYENIAKEFHGTGDVFAALFISKMCQRIFFLIFLL